MTKTKLKASQKKPENGLVYFIPLHPSVLMEVLYVLKAAAEPSLLENTENL